MQTGGNQMRRALVTGAGRGIGSAAARQLRLAGYEVFAPARAELDLADRESIEKFLHKYSDTAFDVLINNAGIHEPALVEEISEADIQSMFEVNLYAPLRLIQGVVPNMKKNWYGRIVNTGSIWGMAGKAGRSVYAATKHGLHGITQTLAVELAPYNILINTVCPGFTLTDLTRKNLTEDQMKETASVIPAGRMAEPEEPAKLICFLAGEDNTYITGQQIAVDGGYTSL